MWILFSWVVQELSLINKSSKSASSISYETRRLRLWIFLIKFYAALLQNIQIKGQYQKVDKMKASDRRFACSNDKSWTKNLRILAKTCKQLLDVLHNFSICIVKESLSSIVITSSLTLLLDFTLDFASIINVVCNQWSFRSI